jgi:hypothetical protein
MAKASVAAWSACIKELQQLVAEASSQGFTRSTHAADRFQSFVQRISKVNPQQPLSHAAWKKLVQDVQVVWPFVERLKGPEPSGTECCGASTV